MKLFYFAPARWFAFGQIGLGLCLLVCVVLVPHYFFSLDQGGVSNYGTESQTIALFTVGFGAAALGSLLAALSLPRRMARRNTFRASLVALSLLYGFVLFTTFSYKVNDAYRELHEQAALVLFAAMLIEALWLRFVAVKDRRASWAFAALSVGLVLGVLTLAGTLHVLFLSQLICGASFGYLLVHAITTLMGNQPTDSQN